MNQINKTMKQLFTIVVLLIGVSVSATAQYAYKHNASHHYYKLPHHVVKKAHRLNRHNDFVWVGSRTFIRGKNSFFVITMKDGNRFVEYTMNHHGFVISKRSYFKHRHMGRSKRYARSGGYGIKFRNDRQTVTYEYWSPGVTYNRWR